MLALPFMNTIVIPTVLLTVFRDAGPFNDFSPWRVLQILAALPLLALGIGLVVRAIMLFVRRGRGTLAPWDPTEVLITEDIYRYSRNPMKAGLFLVLIAEVLLLRSTVLTIWAAAFIAVNVVYIRWFEEPGLTARFGEAYAEYCRSVPRWLGWSPGRKAPASEPPETMAPGSALQRRMHTGSVPGDPS